MCVMMFCWIVCDCGLVFVTCGVLLTGGFVLIAHLIGGCGCLGVRVVDLFVWFYCLVWLDYGAANVLLLPCLYTGGLVFGCCICFGCLSDILWS